ncbi:MAG TPA: hypothetical protein VMF58_06420 [Rhizomicrobium sp.]|nr:hypothetical protein [Rhizomicrobium sp.]
MTGYLRTHGETVAIALAALVMALPLWCVTAPPMPDYPAHLASYYLIATDAKAAAVSSFYSIHWAWIPNLAGEILIPPMSHLIGLETATKLFITAGVAMWVIGPALIHRALYGRVGIAPLFAALFAYNANFTWGFLNYYFAMGAAFLVFAAWIATDRRRTFSQMAGFILAVTALYFAHLFAMAVLLLFIACFELDGLAGNFSMRATLRRALTVAIPFVPAAFAFVFLKPRGGAGGVAFNTLDRLLDRLEAALQLTYDNASFVLLALLTILLVAGLWRGWIGVHRRMLFVLPVLAIVTVFAPEWAMGGWGVDLRLPAVLGALVFASLEFRLERGAALTLAAAACAAILVNAAVLAQDWRTHDGEFNEFRTAARTLKPGTKLLTVLDGDAIGFRSDQPYWHMAEYAIVDPGVFTPLLFTTRDQHVVRLNPEYQSIAAASAQQGSPPDIDELEDLAAGRADQDEDIKNVFPYLMRFQCHYDVAIVIHLNGPRSAIPPMLKLRHAGSFYDLYDIVPDDACTGK